jgi:hypothetical protein
MTRQKITNPETNKLIAGVTEADITNAVGRSGYPLQSIVADLCEELEFRTVQEWGFVDKDSGHLRTLDVKAEKYLFDGAHGAEARVRPSLVLLIECKQSQLPYIFFLARHPIRISHFPVLAGLHHNEIALKTDDDRSTYNVGILGALDLESHKFVVDDPEFCSSFSKCVRKGKELELSGSEPFLEVVSPLVKALHHFRSAVEPPKTALYFDLFLALAVAVIDGPMVGIKVKGKTNELTFLPWVRTVRHEYWDAPHRWERGRAFAVDIVHKDFFRTYVEEYVQPFAVEFSRLALKHHEVIASGKGFAEGMAKVSYRKIESCLKARANSES